ncbi:MAG: sulfatase [Gemmatimonadetes bacterium]|nr:sulfatase [Gemmatimonadota bacterium]
MENYKMSAAKPNVILVFGDQWRAQDTGYAGNPQVRTPNLDRFAAQSVNATHAVSGCSVCSPARASLLTGQYPLTHGIFVNDVCLQNGATSMAQAFKAGGYDTAYIGKWHIDGHGRTNYIPPERRQGFEYWKVLECTHSYNESYYYAGDSDEKLAWENYDAEAQTKDAQQYIRDHQGDDPFLMVLSWGPPHAPYETAPAKYRAQYRREDIELRPNVPPEKAADAAEWIAGYYAHCTALDDCMADLLQTLEDQGIDDNTLVLFFSDHGDMLGSQGWDKKQKPWEESIRVPFLLRYPALLGTEGRQVDALIDIPDIMPTLLGLCQLNIPESVEGLDFSGYLRGGDDPSDGAALLSCPHPFGQWHRQIGGREYRGLRTKRYTYARSLDGPWLLYDNERDPYQLENLVDSPDAADLLKELDQRLSTRLALMGDEFLPGDDYLHQWGYQVDEKGTVPYRN